MGQVIAAILLALALLGGCTVQGSYNALQSRDEKVSAAWAKVQSVYKKRADLVPNLVETVKNYASHEAGVFRDVTEARAKATQVVLPANASADQIAAFAAAQKELSVGLGRLLAVAEQYPQLKANENFLQLQKQLQSVESQATAARNQYVEEVRYFNTNVRTFPSNLVAGWFGVTIKPQLQFDDAEQIKHSPRVDFGKKT